jgi:hypothetical protein
MIKHNEVRIGNFVQHELSDKYSIVKRECFEKPYYLNDYNPIPLTEEWLLRLGFEKLHNDYYILNAGDFELRYYYNVSGSAWKFELNNSLINITCVHQLQNLYHALTGKELEIKL